MRTVRGLVGVAMLVGFVACSSKQDPANHGSTPGSKPTGEAGEGNTPTGDGGALNEKPLAWSKVSGVAQKGPFLNGASVTLSELDPGRAPTGRSFQTSILDDTGAFTLKNVELVSSIATLRVDGFFFNEVRNASSTSQITLNAIVDLSDDQSTNVNLLSHLEKGRVEALLDGGSTFEAAKAKAEAEIFAIFGFNTPVTSQADNVDLAAATDEAASLLALSVILLGYRSDAELTEALANIATDIRTDGKLDSQKTLAALVAHARALDPAAVRQNLEARYEALGKSVKLAAFEPLIASFVAAHTDVPATPLVDYPKDSLLQVLAAGQDGMALAIAGQNDFRKLVLPGAGLPLRVVLRTAPTAASWVYSNPSGLNITPFAGCEQAFSLVDPKTTGAADVGLYAGDLQILVYEGNQKTPGWSRKFSVSNPSDGGFGACTFGQ